METQNIVWLVILIGIFILFFVYSHFKNKRDRERYEQMTNNLEKGDKVLTSAGIVGKIVSIENKDTYKLVTIETGNLKNKGYVTFDSQAIYTVLEKKNQNVGQSNNDSIENKETVAEEPVEEKNENTYLEEKDQKTSIKKNKKKNQD